MATWLNCCKTKALHPLDVLADSHKMPETYPFGE